ncbi:MAG: RNA polymerase sigma factor [Bacillota bacterium]|nr:RNA polymerase sigma factor [Bacillota bacterium]
MTDIQKEQIYRDYHHKIYNYIYSKVQNVQDAEDMSEDVVLKVFERFDSFDKNKSSLSTWIYTITKNTLIDYYRTRKVWTEIPESLGSGFSVEDKICSTEMLEILSRALAVLEDRERDIIILRFYSGKTLKEITEKMGISYAYGKVLQNRAFDKIRKYFEK